MVRWDPYLEPALFIIYRSPGSRSVIRNYGSVKLLSLDVVSQGKIPVGAFVLRTVVHFEEGCWTYSGKFFIELLAAIK